MFNFYVILAGHDTVTDAGRVTTCIRKVKAPSLETKITKNEWPPENMGFQSKREETLFWTFQKNTVEQAAPKYKNWKCPCNQEEENRIKVEKTIRLKLLEL